MTVEHVGPGGVSNSYGVRTTTSKVVYENDNSYQDVFIPTGSVPVVATPSGSGPVTVETAATFAAISASTSPRTVIVIADETNGGERTVYFHDGSALNWLPTVGLE